MTINTKSENRYNVDLTDFDLACNSLITINSFRIARPQPDGKPGDVTKPAEVSIPAGQSNMVGMGDIAGARPSCPNLFLSAPAKAGYLEILSEQRSRLLL